MTIGLKSVENPLEFGIVVTDEDGRIERFLEKPSWGQVFSDTINTGIYVLEPEVLQPRPDRPAVRLLEGALPAAARDGPAALRLRAATATGRTSATSTSTGRRTSTRSTRRCASTSPGIRLRGNVWLGEGVEIDDLEEIEGPGVHRQLLPHRAGRVGRPVLGALDGVTLRERARTTRSVIDASTHIGRSALDRGRDPRPRRATSATHVAHPRGRRDRRRGDARRRASVSCRGVRIYPYKEVESGAQIHESLIWESRASTRLFGKDGVAGLVNVDLTPETAVRLAAALGTALKRGARVVASRESAPRVPDDQARDDLRPELDRRRRRRPARAAGGGRPPPAEDAGLRRRLPRRLEPRRSRGVFRSASSSSPGIQLTPRCRRRSRSTSRAGAPPRRLRRGRLDHAIRRACARATRRTCSTTSTSRRSARAASGSSSTTATRRRRTCCRSCSGRSASRRSRRTGSPRTRDAAAALREAIGQAKRLVPAVGADLGVVFDRAAERLYLIDEQGREIPVEQALLLYLRLIGADGRRGQGRLPDHRHEPRRRPGRGDGARGRPHAGVARRADEGRRRGRRDLRGRRRRRLRLPGVPARLRRDGEPLQAARAARAGRAGRCRSSSPSCPATLVHRQLPCPWALKGTVMRVLTERLRDRTST